MTLRAELCLSSQPEVRNLDCVRPQKTPVAFIFLRKGKDSEAGNTGGGCHMALRVLSETRRLFDTADTKKRRWKENSPMRPDTVSHNHGPVQKGREGKLRTLFLALIISLEERKQDREEREQNRAPFFFFFPQNRNRNPPAQLSQSSSFTSDRPHLRFSSSPNTPGNNYNQQRLFPSYNLSVTFTLIHTRPTIAAGIDPLLITISTNLSTVTIR